MNYASSEFYVFSTGSIILFLLFVWNLRKQIYLHKKLEKTKRRLYHSLSYHYEDILSRISIKEQQEMIQEMVDKGSNKLEKLNKDTSEFAFTLLDVVLKNPENTKKVKDIHESLSKGVFNAIRGSNEKIGKLTDKLLKIEKKTKNPES